MKQKNKNQKTVLIPHVSSFMKLLGIDYGDKRIGIAVSDETMTFAFPRVVLQNTKTVFEEIKKICGDENIAKIVVGMPTSFSGGKSAQAEKTEKFGKALEAFLGIPVGYENEIFTTKIGRDDASAAALILQSYLDKIRK
ncbi:MAG TPA: Holliday junction resolvase RuvX [Candidatus Paceibacterota bacterium]